MGRPRSVHPPKSQPTAGIGGRLFTAVEKAALLDIAELYVDPDCFDGAQYLEQLWRAHGSYLAGKNAEEKQVGLADELSDLAEIIRDAQTVRQLLADHLDSINAVACVGPAGSLADRLRHFPNMVEAETTAMHDGVHFMHGKARLRDCIVQVRHWPDNRAQLIADLDTVLNVCATVPKPIGFTKRFKTARDRFRRRLGVIYDEMLHPERLLLRQEARTAYDDYPANDPPLPRSHRAFARAVMAALGVKFETKSRKR